MKKALITGASRGIGRAIAEELSRDHHIYAGSSGNSNEVVHALDSAEPFAVDLRDPAAITKACGGIDELDVLVHAAGVFPQGSFDEITDQQWRETFDINLFSGVQLVHELLPALRRSHGLIIMINSGAGLKGIPNLSAYVSSKYALKGFTDSLRIEEQGKVGVTSIYPGRVDTDMTASVDLPKIGVSEIAKAVRLAVDAGPDAVVDGLRVSPLRM